MSSRTPTRGRKEPEAPVSVRLEPSLLGALRTQARASGKPISRLIREMLDEAMRTRRYPGINFVEGPAGRRAHLAGTALDVWEVIELLREHGSTSTLRDHFPRLSPMAIQVAEAYAQEYREEIEAFLEANSQTPQQLRRRVPWLEVVQP